MKSKALRGALLPALLLAAACGRDAASPPLAPEEGTPVDPAGVTLSIVSGNGQTGVPGSPLDEPVVVRVTEGGRPVAGTAVHWRLSDGGGRLSDAVTVTDAAGLARATWVLGADDASTLDVSVGASALVSLSAWRTGLVRSDVKLVRVSGDAQTAMAGTSLGQPLVARVMSSRGPMAGVKVRWETVGGGRITVDSAVSAADGTVAARWTLGPTGGAQSAMASVPGTAAPVAFHANAIPASGEPVTLVVVSGDGQGARVGTALAAPLVVRATNAAGTPLSGVQVSWSVKTGGGTITPATITTDGSGLASARWTMGASAGAGTAAATAADGVEVTFSANALPAGSRVTALVKTLGDGQVECPGCGLREGIRVMAVDGEGNPVPNAPITWTPSHGGTLQYSTTVTDATGTAGAGWVLGTTAGVQTLTATSGTATTTFTATASLGGDGVVAFIQMNPGRTGLEPGDSSHVYAVALDTGSRGVPGAVLTWSTDVPGIIEFTVDPVGTYYGRAKFRALQYGEVRLTASAGGQSNTVVIRVRPDYNNGGGGGSADRGTDPPPTVTP